MYILCALHFSKCLNIHDFVFLISVWVLFRKKNCWRSVNIFHFTSDHHQHNNNNQMKSQPDNLLHQNITTTATQIRCCYELQQQHHKYQEPTTTITTTDISEVQRKKEIKSNLLFAIICNNFLNLSNFIYIQQPSSFKRSSKSSGPVKDECRHTFYRNQMVNGECKMHIVAKRERRKKPYTQRIRKMSNNI